MLWSWIIQLRHVVLRMVSCSRDAEGNDSSSWRRPGRWARSDRARQGRARGGGV